MSQSRPSSLAFYDYDAFMHPILNTGTSKRTWTLVIVFRVMPDACCAKRVPTGRQRARIPEDFVT
jgi:hypothetical protein